MITAEIALVSYTLLILFRNIITGLREVPAEVLEAAARHGHERPASAAPRRAAAGCSGDRRRARIATVTMIALATIAYVISNQGLGVPIHDALGEGPFKTELIVAGGLAIVLALLADALLVRAQRLLDPVGAARGRRRTL